MGDPGLLRKFPDIPPLSLQEGPKAIAALKELIAGAHRLGPRRLLATFTTQLHNPLQRGHKRLPDRPDALM